MKILAIRGRNLASLGQFALELESAPLKHAGLFAITGPTGAGKSTLLDALCLALFDKTPRLASRGGVPIGRATDDDADRLLSNDVRSLLRRGTSEGFAEVDFVGRGDRCYRARWTVRRARKRPDGRMQPQVMELSEIETGKILGGTKSETLAAIEEKLGLTFEQFTRSALLAQGQFAAFLRADAKHRADLLERMTGTEIYGEISAAAYRRAEDAKRTLAGMLEMSDAASVLDDEARVALETNVEAAGAALEVDRGQAKAAEQAIVWYRRQHELEVAAAAADTEAVEARTKQVDAEPTRLQLATVLVARELRAPVEAADRASELANCAADDVKASDACVREAKTAAYRADEALGHASRALGVARDRHKVELVRQLRALEADIEGARCWLDHHASVVEDVAVRGVAGSEAMSLWSIGELDERRLRFIDVNGAAREAHGVAVRFRADAKTRHESAKAIADRDATAAAQSPVEPLRIQRQGLLRRRELCQGLVVAIDGVRAAASAGIGHRAAAAEHLARASTLGTTIAVADARAEGIATAVDAAEAAYDRLRLALDLSDHRGSLVDGEPCPVCGAEQHPWADDSDGSSVASLAADQKTSRDQLRLEARVLSRELAEHRAAVSVARAAADEKNAAAALADGDIELHRARFDQLITELGELAGLYDPTSDDAIDDANARLDTIEKDLLEVDSAEVAARKLDSLAVESREKADARRSDMEQAREQLEERERGLRTAELELAQCDATRVARRVATIEGDTGRGATLRVRLDSAATASMPRQERAVAAAEASRQAAAQNLASAIARAEAAALARDKRTTELVVSKQALTESLSDAELSLEAVREQLAITDNWIERTKALLEQLQRVAREHSAVAKERRYQLERHSLTSAEASSLTSAKASSLTSAEASSLEQAQQVYEATAEKVATSTQVYADLLSHLRADDHAHAKRNEMTERIEEQKRGAQIYQQLSELIGSADGKKFRVFAQSLTLDSLLAFANEHLRELAGRYRLVRVPGYDLDLQIIDRDLGDEVRSVQSLSGGESFLVSLALALGLASLSARDTRVESLLVDEGFGSLDPATLDVALGVLDALQASGRKVGLISHVPGLAERIGVQVRVTPRGGGRSVVSVIQHGV